jgi:hypothetical protein
MVEFGVETEEPSTRQKEHEFADRETQTNSGKRKQSVEGCGPSSKQKRLQNVYPDSACGYTSPTGEHSENEWEVASPSASPQKNKLPRLKLRKIGTHRPMQAALRLTLPDGARSGFERGGGYADEVERLARLESRAITLRNLGLEQTIPPRPIYNTPPEPSETQTEAPLPPASPIIISGDATRGDVNEPPVGNVVAQQDEIVAAVERVQRPVPNLFPHSNHQEHILLPGGRGDRPLIRHVPAVRFRMPPIRINFEELERFFADRHLTLEGIDMNDLMVELMKRMIVMEGTFNETTDVWPPLRRPVYRKHSRELIAFMAFVMYLYGNSKLALNIIYCISKYTKPTILKLMDQIFDGRFRY